MAVTLDHHDGAITAVGSMIDRAPWTTCPGAPAVLARTFAGAALAEAAGRGSKQANCTHLYDLAVLAAAHALDRRELVYDILVCDPVDGTVLAEIRRDGVAVLDFELRDDVLIGPETAAGTSLFKLRGWIAALPAALHEPARLLQWGTILAHGRTTPMDRQSDATRMPPNCYTFQDDKKKEAIRVGGVIDFSQGTLTPLDHLAGDGFRRREA